MSKPKYTYFMGEFSSTGVPANLNYDPNGAENNTDLKKTISSTLLKEISTNLPERVRLPNSRPEWLKNSDIHIKSDTDLTLTFLDEGAGYKNGIGYYIYDSDVPPRTESDIKVLYVTFPNFSKVNAGGSLVAGDTVKLASEFTTVKKGNIHVVTPTSYTFKAGQSIGFVIFVNAFRTYKGSMNHWANGSGRKYYSNPALNPESKIENRYHTVNIKSTEVSGGILIGFEDLYRPYGDDDFNDATMLLEASDFNAIDDSSINYSSKQESVGTILCDDLISDFPYVNNDYSDNIIEYKTTVYCSSDSVFVSKIEMDFHLKYRSTLYDHEFGLKIDGLGDLHHSISRELFIGNNPSTIESIKVDDEDRLAVFPSTKTALPGSGNHKHYANTHPGWDADGIRTPVSSCRIVITFPNAVERSSFTEVKAPFKQYLKVYPSMVAGTGDHYMIECNKVYYANNKLDDLPSTKKDGVMKIINLVNVVDYQCSHEYIKMIECYPELYDYLKSDGKKNVDWWRYSRPQYLNPHIPITERTWSI